LLQCRVGVAFIARHLFLLILFVIFIWMTFDCVKGQRLTRSSKLFQRCSKVFRSGPKRFRSSEQQLAKRSFLVQYTQTLPLARLDQLMENLYSTLFNCQSRRWCKRVQFTRFTRWRCVNTQPTVGRHPCSLLSRKQLRTVWADTRK
jgi:hypothetical protein